jgi:hypothetical protein
MSDQDAVDALISDLQWQVEQMRPRGIKNKAGQPYNPSYYKRGLEKAIDSGGLAVPAFVRGYLDKGPSDGFQKLEEAVSLDLACEWLIADESKPYAHLFSDADRTAARARLAPHVDAVEQRQAAEGARIAAATERLRAKGLPRRWDLDAGRHSRRDASAAARRNPR